MKCPSDKCGSSNVEHLPHYWLSLPGESPLKGRYAQPDAVDGRLLLGFVAVAVLGVVLMVTGSVTGGLLMLAVGGVGAVAMRGRISMADTARAAWDRSQICLACTHLWVP